MIFNFIQIFKPANYAFNPYAIPNLIVTISVLALGFFVFLHNKKSMVNFSFLALCLSASLWLFGLAMCYLSKNEAIAVSWGKVEYAGLVFLTTNIYAFSVAYLKLKRQKKFVALGYLLSFLFLVASWTQYFAIGMEKHFWGYYHKFNFLHPFFVLFFFIFMFASICNFYKEYKKETQVIERGRRKYIFLAFLIAITGSVDYLAVYGIEVYPFGYLPAFICIAIFAYTIVKYRLMDIETVIHRTITYILLSVIIFTISYLGILILTHAVLKGPVRPQDILATGFFVLFFLFLITPLKNKTQYFVDKLFYKDKYDYRNTLESFAKKISLFLDSPDLFPSIVDVFAQNLHIDKVSLMLLDEEAQRYTLRQSRGSVDTNITLEKENPFVEFLQSYGDVVERELLIIDPKFEQAKTEGLKVLEKLQAELIIPLVVQQGVVGILGLGMKLSGEAYKTEDIHLLSTIGQELAVAINNRLLYEGLEEANKELRDTQVQLIQSAKMAAVGQLGAGVAHELNNPLGGILGYAQFILEKIKRPEFSPQDFKSCIKYMESIERESTRCKGIVESLLKFSRRPIIVKPEPLDIAEALKETLAIIGHQLKLKNITLTTDIPEGLGKVFGITNQLQQVFANLILNAQQAMPEGGELKITARNILGENKIKIEFTDTGFGISEESLKHLFEPFFTTKQKEKGTGLGLAVSYQIIQEHGGTIEIKSVVGKGTTVIIKLPLA